MQWICVSWVFNYDSIFTKVTQTAQRMAPGNISLLELPIPESVYSTINNSRVVALSSIFDFLKKRRQSLEGKDSVCSFECDSLVLGTILKSLKINGLSDVRFPYLGISVERAVQKNL